MTCVMSDVISVCDIHLQKYENNIVGRRDREREGEKR